jgi:hypothetical protein
MQNSLDKCTAARNRVAAGKQASWPFSQPRKKVLMVLQVL